MKYISLTPIEETSDDEDPSTDGDTSTSGMLTHQNHPERMVITSRKKTPFPRGPGMAGRWLI